MGKPSNSNSIANTKATLFGFFAILLWGMLALLTALSGHVPPFQLTTMTFFIAFLIGAAAFIRRGCDWKSLRQPVAVWVNGICGLFLYYFSLFVG